MKDMIFEAVHPATGTKVNVLAMTIEGFNRMNRDAQLDYVGEAGWERTDDGIEDAHSAILKYEGKIETRCQHLYVGDCLFFW